MKVQTDFFKTLFFIFGLFHFSFSQISLSLNTKKVDYLIGDQIEAELIVVHPKDVKISIETPSDHNLKPFSVLSYHLSAPVPYGKDLISQSLKLNLSVYALGRFNIPPIKLNLSDKDGKTSVIASLPYPIAVKSVLDAKEAQTPYDIKEIVSTNYSATLLFYALITSLVLFLLFFFLRRFLKRRRKQLSVIEKSLRLLKRLEEANYLVNGNQRLFFYKLSSVVKNFLGGYLRKPFASMTTKEIERQISPEQFENAQILLDILKYSDKVKFAPNHDYDYEKTLLFVEELKQILRTEEEKNKKKK